jgi:hypothetical protein
MKRCNLYRVELFFSGWKQDTKGGSLSGYSFGPDISPVIFYHALYNRQAYPGAGMLQPVLRKALKNFKDLPCLLLVEPLAIVF